MTFIECQEKIGTLQWLIGKSINGHKIEKIIALPNDLPSDLHKILLAHRLGILPSHPNLQISPDAYQPLGVSQPEADDPTLIIQYWLTDDFVNGLEKAGGDEYII